MTAPVVKVYTQADLDDALASPARSRIAICGSGSFLLRDMSRHHVISARETSHVVVRDLSRVQARDHARVEARDLSLVVARDSAHVVARDSSRIVAFDSSQVEARDSSQVEASGASQIDASGTSRVVAQESSRVTARESSRIVAANPLAVDRCSATAMVRIVAERPRTGAEWCDWYGVPVVDGVATLFKVVRQDFASPRDPWFLWTPGTQPAAKHYDAAEGSDGLYFAPYLAIAAIFYREPGPRFIACPVRVDELVVFPNSSRQGKVKAKRVHAPVYEVGRDGNSIAATVSLRGVAPRADGLLAVFAREWRLRGAAEAKRVLRVAIRNWARNYEVVMAVIRILRKTTSRRLSS